jgi:hypothetical protein
MRNGDPKTVLLSAFRCFSPPEAWHINGLILISLRLARGRARRARSSGERAVW